MQKINLTGGCISHRSTSVHNDAGVKAVLKSPHSRRSAIFVGPVSARQRLECGAFTAAFGAGVWLAVGVFVGSLFPTSAAPVASFAGKSPLQWSVRMADSQMKRLGDRLAWTEGGNAKWDYTAGLFTLSLLKLNECETDPARLHFVTNAIGSFISADGKIQGYKPGEYQLDALNPGKTVLALWQLTKEERYVKCAMLLRQQLNTQPRTGDGGFWHKQRYTNQMWLDGLFMAAPFYAQCAATTLFCAAPTDFDDVAKQIRLMDEHAYDPASGLFYHGWDDKKTQAWANPANGCSSNFWGRAGGWYAMALVDTLDFFPTNHPARKDILTTLQKLAAGVVKHQDPVSGVWWQVMDQGGRPGNYLEATASAMFVYALAKGVNKNYLPPNYVPAILKGYQGILKNFIHSDTNGVVSLTQCCQVAGLGFTSSGGRPRDGSFDYYVSEPIVENDLKGVGPFILASLELQKLQAQPPTTRRHLLSGDKD